MTLFAPPCVWQAENLSFHSEVSVTQNRTCVIVFVYCGRCWCQRGKEKREQDPLSNRVSIFLKSPTFLFSLSLALWPFDYSPSVSLCFHHRLSLFLSLSSLSPFYLCRPFVRVSKSSFVCKRFYFCVCMCLDFTLILVCTRHFFLFCFFEKGELQDDDIGRATFLPSFLFISLQRKEKCKQ